MTPEQRLKQYNPSRLIIGYDAKGKFMSVVCETKIEIVEAVKLFDCFKVYRLVESENEEWYRNRVKIFVNLNSQS